MFLKNLMICTSVMATFGMGSFAQASDFPVSCAKNDGGPKNCISISNNTQKNISKLRLMCDTEKGHYIWTISISAGTQNQCLDLSSRCKITRILNEKKHKAEITVEDDLLSTSCNWPDAS